MQTAIDYSVALLAWTITAYKVRDAWQQRHDWRVFSSWLFVFFFACSMTFQIDAVYLGFDALVGVANISWLLSYVFLATATYFAASGCRCAVGKPNFKWMRLLFFATVTALILMFWANISSLPEQTNHNRPYTLAELTFSLVLYSYAVGMGSIAVATFAHFYKVAEDTISKIRTGFVLASAVTAVMFFLLGIVGQISYYLIPEHAALKIVSLLTMILMGNAGTLWVFAFFPQKAYVHLIRPFLFFSKLCTVRELGIVQRYVNQFCTPVAVLDNLKMSRIRALDFHIYQAIINILDGKKLFSDHFNNLDDNLFPDWNGAMQQQAMTLYQLLNRVDDDVDYEELLSSYQQLGRSLKKEMLPEKIL